jgi:2-polyprenyl-3-methyl-5-hydroxy-6-metoxy-1,4-benzoquinol methylase
MQSYRGILMRAAPGTHELVAARIVHLLPANSRVLDVGAGEGALSLRLVDAGDRVVAVDIDKGEWNIEQVPFSVLHIDDGLRPSADGIFDAIVCVEVVEHLEDPWRSFRECRELLRPEGYLLLTTPNVTSFLSRLQFLIRGRFHQFEPSDLVTGHIYPMTSFEIETIAERTGWTIAEVQPVGYLPILDFSTKSPMSILINLGRLGAYLLARVRKHGWCLAFVLRRST